MKTPEKMSDEQIWACLPPDPDNTAFARAVEAERDRQWIEMLEWQQGPERFFPFEFEVWQGGEMVASASGPRDLALREVMHYAAQYGQDGPVRVFEVTRTLLTLGSGYAHPSPEDVTVKYVGMPVETGEMAQSAHRLASWLSAALDDPNVCQEYKDDINAWFDCGMPFLPEQRPAGEPK